MESKTINTGSTAVALLGTILLATPLAPIGATMLTCSTIVGGANTLGDMGNDARNSEMMKALLEEEKSQSSEFKNI